MLSSTSPSSTDTAQPFINPVTSYDRQCKIRAPEALDQVQENVNAATELSDDDGSVWSNQSDFGSADDSDVDQKTKEGARNRNRCVKRQSDEAAQGLNGGLRDVYRRRRQTVYWSVDEKAFLLHGVEKYGKGKWKKILLDGQSVFSKHRTNVDLKDKWKNVQKTMNRERSIEGNNLTPASQQHKKQQSVRQASKASAKKSGFRDEVRTNLPSDSAQLTINRSTADVAMASAQNQEVDVDSLIKKEVDKYRDRGACSDADIPDTHQQLEETVMMFATDQSFPKFIEVRVSLNTCKDVFALKKHLRLSILSELSPDTAIQMIGLKSRQLFEDDELLVQCIEKNGVAFVLVYDDVPEVFV